MTEANPGRFHRVDPAVVDDDPFWSVVRRRHPDVTLVLTPTVEPDRTAEEPATAPMELLLAAADGVLETWHLLRPLVLAAGVTDPPSIRWGAKGGEHALVVEKGMTGLGRDGGVELLREVARTLDGAGWRLRPAGRGELRTLQATNGHTDLRAVSGAGATVLTIATGVLPVSAVDRETVAGELRQVITSWQ